MFRFLGLLIGVLAAHAASANPDCVDLDRVAQICPVNGARTLGQSGTYWVGSIADPDTGFISGIGIEVADGCRFGAFAGEYPATACRPGSLGDMKQFWAEAFETADSVENGGAGRRKLVDIAPMHIGGHFGHMARYRSDYSDTGRRDIREAVFMTDVGGRHFLFWTADLRDTARLDKMAWRIGKVISFIQFTNGKQ